MAESGDGKPMNCNLRVRCVNLGLAVAMLAPGLIVYAQGAEVVGRIVDNVDARVFEGAGVEFRTLGGSNRTVAVSNQLVAGANRTAMTDGYGYFRVRDVDPGPYVLDVTLPDGRTFMARLFVAPRRQVQYLELDYSRVVPPGDDDDY